MKVELSDWQSKVWTDDSRFKVINIGRRGGKTLLSVIKMASFALENKKTIVWYIAPTYKQAKLIAWAMLKEYIPKGTGVFNETELKCTLINGSEICLKGADNPDSLRGTRIDFAVFDEVAFFTNWSNTWEALRPILVDSKAHCWFISTPNGFNHFYDMYHQEDLDTDYKSFHFTSYDNPHIDAEEIEKTRKEMTPRGFAQEFMAEFNKPEGTVYVEWDLTHFQDCPYDAHLPVHLSFDFGVNDPTSIVWIQPNGGEYRVIDYYEKNNANIEHFVQVIRSKPYHEPELITGDPAGKARSITTNTHPIEEYAKHGIHITTKDGVKIPDQIRATHKIIPSLYVDKRCERFRDCLLNYRYPSDLEKTSKLDTSREIPIHDEYSHAMRALEYYAVNEKDFSGREPEIIGYEVGFGGVKVPKYQF